MPVFLSLLITSCSGYSLTGGPGPLINDPLSTEVSAHFEPLRINQIAFLPLERSYGVELSDSKLQSLSEAAQRAFERNTNVELLRPELNTQQIIPLSNAEQGTPLFTRARKLGSDVAAQGVLCGVITHYPKEENSSTNRPAGSVGFKLWIVDPKSGKPLWTATFEKTQQPLSENLFGLGRKLKEGVRYKEADELMRSGFIRAATELEKLRLGKL